MNIEFVSRHAALDDQIRLHAEERIGRMAKLLGEPVAVHVTLESEKHRQIAEIRIRQRRGELLAREEALASIDALNLAADKIEAQARRKIERRASRRRRSAAAVASAAAAAAATAAATATEAAAEAGAEV